MLSQKQSVTLRELQTLARESPYRWRLVGSGPLGNCAYVVQYRKKLRNRLGFVRVDIMLPRSYMTFREAEVMVTTYHSLCFGNPRMNVLILPKPRIFVYAMVDALPRYLKRMWGIFLNEIESQGTYQKTTEENNAA